MHTERHDNTNDSGFEDLGPEYAAGKQRFEAQETALKKVDDVLKQCSAAMQDSLLDMIMALRLADDHDLPETKIASTLDSNMGKLKEVLAGYRTLGEAKAECQAAMRVEREVMDKAWNGKFADYMGRRAAEREEYRAAHPELETTRPAPQRKRKRRAADVDAEE